MSRSYLYESIDLVCQHTRTSILVWGLGTADASLIFEIILALMCIHDLHYSNPVFVNCM